jgi:hypothetical protein
MNGSDSSRTGVPPLSSVVGEVQASDPEPSVAAAAVAPMTFRSRGVALDILLLLVLVPIGGATLTFLFLFLVVALAESVDVTLTDRVAIMAAAGPALLVTLLAAAWTSCWSITLDEGSFRIGSIWRRRIPYERVVYISVGHMDDAWLRLRKVRPGTVPLAIVTGLFSKWRLFLDPKSAERCLHELYRRSPNAGALDLHGKTYAPRNPNARRPAQIRIAEALTVRSIGAFGVAAAGVLVLLVPLLRSNADGGVSFNRLSDEMVVGRATWMLVPLIPAASAYGVATLRRLRRVLQGQFDRQT